MIDRLRVCVHATDKGRKKIAVCEQEKKKKLHHRTNKRLARQLGYRQTARQTVKCSLVKKVEKSKPKQKLDENHTSANTHTPTHTRKSLINKIVPSSRIIIKTNGTTLEK